MIEPKQEGYERCGVAIKLNNISNLRELNAHIFEGILALQRHLTKKEVKHNLEFPASFTEISFNPENVRLEIEDNKMKLSYDYPALEEN